MLAMPKKQRGAVLIFALLVLLVMTVLGVSGVGNSVLEERMSGNYQQSHASFQSTEFALRVAETWLTANVTRDNVNVMFRAGSPQQGLYSMTTGIVADEICQGNAGCFFNPRSQADWCSIAGCPLQNGFATLGTNDLPPGNLPAVGGNPASQPQFVIEYLGQYSTSTGGRTGNGGGANGYQHDPFSAGNMHVFKVTAIGWGGEPNVRNVLQNSFHLPL